jgi:hypothetical protein
MNGQAAPDFEERDIKMQELRAEAEERTRLRAEEAERRANARKAGMNPAAVPVQDIMSKPTVSYPLSQALQEIKLNPDPSAVITAFHTKVAPIVRSAIKLGADPAEVKAFIDQKMDEAFPLGKFDKIRYLLGLPVQPNGGYYGTSSADASGYAQGRMGIM